jgi:putative ABC transport system permease protein
VYAVLLRPLPYAEQDRLVTLSEWSQQVPGMSISYPNFLDWQARQKCFSSISVARGQSFNYVGTNETERIVGAMATHDLFAALGVPPLRGRLFTAEEDKPSAERTVVIRESLWNRSFGGRDAALGEKMQLDGDIYTIIGVLPDAFQYPGRRTELWTPLGLSSDQYRDRFNHPGLYGVARLKPGVTFETARAEMQAIAGQLAREYPADNAGITVSLQRLTDRVFRGVRPSLLVLLGAAGFVLLIACTNVANLQLARAHARSREFAVRAALGAGRGRVVRQLLSESVLLGLLGCAAGLMLGTGAIHMLRAGLPANIPRLQEAGLNGWVLAFAIGASLVTSIVFGLVPAISAARHDLREVLAPGGRTGGSRRSHRWHATLIIGEFALTCLLLVGANLMLRTLANLYRADPGYTTERIVTFNLDMPGPAFQQTAQRLSLLDRALDRLTLVPGVTRVGIVNPLPLSGGGNQSTYYVEGTPVPEPGQSPSAERIQVNGDYFATLGIPLKAGRTFTPQDLGTAPPVAIVDTLFVEKWFQGQDPIGKRFAYGTRPPTTDSGWLQIVGVVAHIQNYGLREPTREQTYLPYRQNVPGGMAFVVRTQGDPAGLVPLLRAGMHEVAGNLPIFNIRTMDDLFQGTISTERLTVLLLGVFAALALLLAAVGLYGVLGYSVGQRTREIGIRTALGATPRSAVILVLRDGLELAGLGLLLGLLAALGLARFLRSTLYEVSPFDLVSFVAVALVLVGVGLLACWLPARRAARIDPMVALRHE